MWDQYVGICVWVFQKNPSQVFHNFVKKALGLKVKKPFQIWYLWCFLEFSGHFLRLFFCLGDLPCRYLTLVPQGVDFLRPCRWWRNQLGLIGPQKIKTMLPLYLGGSDFSDRCDPESWGVFWLQKKDGGWHRILGRNKLNWHGRYTTKIKNPSQKEEEDLS